MGNTADTRQRIVLAAIAILEHDGTAGLTMRRIAREAGVNPAAVNYHFGSKANLLEHVLSVTRSHIFEDWATVLNTAELSQAARLYCMLDILMEGISRYPGMVHTQLFEAGAREQGRKGFAGELGGFLDFMQSRLQGLVPNESINLRLSLAQMILSSLAAALVPELLDAAVGTIPEPDRRDAFLRNLIRGFAGTEVNISREELGIMRELRSMAFSETVDRD
jgi:AcrR family transcriptional regulator